MPKQKTTRRIQTADELAATVHQALSLLATDEADALVNGSADHALLVQAATAQQRLLYAMLAQVHNLKDRLSTRKTFAKSQLVTAQLVHLAYACGVQSALKDSGDA